MILPNRLKVHQINQKIPLAHTGSFSKLFLNYLSKNNSLSNFYCEYPDLNGFEKKIKTRKFGHREKLVEALKKQYQGISNAPEIDLFLNENTFCVTTGHQLNIFTGPLYVVFKIVSTINLAKKLKEKFPAYNFLPVYWMATEDHDFEEISSFNLFGQKHVWETSQKGAVGRMNPSELLEIIFNLKDKPEVFEKAYSQNNTLASSVRTYMNDLFGSEGLVCIDGDDHSLKSLFSSILEDDLFYNSSEKIVNETTLSLEKLGYKSQIHPRNINLFYLENNLRERIEKQGVDFKVLNSDKILSANEMKQILAIEPEKLSPNVVLRPLFQECILPNLAYLGGPSEVTYWLQLKGIFDYHSLSFPIIMPRNFGTIINAATQKRLDKLGVGVEQLFQEEAILKKNFVAKNSEHELSLKHEISEMALIYNAISEKATAIDVTLKGVVEAEKAKQTNALENLEKRIKKAEERNFETAITQLINLKEKLFPGGILQERKENFLNFYLNDPSFIKILLQEFDPLDFQMNIISV